MGRLQDAATSLVDDALELAYATEGSIRYEEVLRMTPFEKSRIGVVFERVNKQREIAANAARNRSRGR